MTAETADHGQFLDQIVAALNQPESEAKVRALAVPEAWERGVLRQLWRLHEDQVVFSSAGVLAPPRGKRTLGCVRYQRAAEMWQPPKSLFLLLVEGEAGLQLDGVYAEIPLALAWLRGWIKAGQRPETFPQDADGVGLAYALCATGRARRGAWLAERVDVPSELVPRIDAMLPEGEARVLGVHALPVIGRMLVGIGVGTDELWLVLAKPPEGVRLRLLDALVRPSLSALVTGAHAAEPDAGQAETDLFLERLQSVLRLRTTLGAMLPTQTVADEEKERRRAELLERLKSAFARNDLPADQAVADAVRAALQPTATKAKGVAELVAAVLGRLADRT